MKKITTQIDSKRFFDIFRSDYVSFKIATADLIDNSIEADTSYVHIKTNEQELFVLDDGKGFTEAELIKALNFAGENNHDKGSLGKFGIGMKVSVLSFFDELSIYSKKDNVWTGGRQNIETIKKEGFYAEVFSEEDIPQNIKDYMSGMTHGTLITGVKPISKDMYVRANQDNCLSKYLGHVYRKILAMGKLKIFINSKTVETIDPLYLKDKRTRILDNSGIYKIMDNDIKIVFSLIPYEYATSRSNGFYLVRNGREIATAEKLHPLLARGFSNLDNLRIELSFDGSLDPYINLNYKKNAVNLSPEFLFQFGSIVEPVFKSLHLEGQTPLEIKLPRKKKENGSFVDRLKSIHGKISIQRESFGQSGPLYSVYPGKSSTRVVVNTDHPLCLS